MTAGYNQLLAVQDCLEDQLLVNSADLIFSGRPLMDMKFVFKLRKVSSFHFNHYLLEMIYH